VREVYVDGRHGDFPVNDDGGFAFVLPLPDGPGVYTIVVWVRAQGGVEPISASNISMRVSEPVGGAGSIALSQR
jgi:hypothetical protein